MPERSAEKYLTKPDFLQGIPSNEEVPLRQVPKERYTSREFLDLEADRLWPHVWQMVCRVEEIPDPGDYFEYRILDQSVIVVRDADNILRAFYNACRHRATQLLEGCGNTPEIRCPFHGWTYSLNGALKYVLSPNEFPAASKFDYGLQSVLVDTWGGFVFINLDRSAPPLLEYLSPVPEHMAGLRWENQELTTAVTCVLPYNWKCAMEAFIEGYHMSGTHPQFCAMTDETSARVEEFGRHSRLILQIGTPSRRLGDVSPEAIFETFFAAKEDTGMIDDELADESLEVLEVPAIPDGMPIGEYFARSRRDVALESGWDIEAIPLERWEQSHTWHIFPNMLLSASVGDTVGWRVRPNGTDPDSCLLEHLALRMLPAGQAPVPPKREFYQDWHDYDSGVILHDQDFPNAARIQRGLHSRGFEGTIYAEAQEAAILHMHDVIDSYLLDP